MPCDRKAQVLWDEFMANTVTLTSKNSKNFCWTFRLSPQRWGACLHQWCRWPPGGICRLQPCMARCYSWTFWAPSHSRWDQNLQLKQPRHPDILCLNVENWEPFPWVPLLCVNQQPAMRQRAHIAWNHDMRCHMWLNATVWMIVRMKLPKHQDPSQQQVQVAVRVWTKMQHSRNKRHWRRKGANVESGRHWNRVQRLVNALSKTGRKTKTVWRPQKHQNFAAESCDPDRVASHRFTVIWRSMLESLFGGIWYPHASTSLDLCGHLRYCYACTTDTTCWVKGRTKPNESPSQFCFDCARGPCFKSNW